LKLQDNIEFLKSIGPERAKLIKNVLGISTVEDFLNFYPIRFLDKSKTYKIRDLKPDESLEVQLKGKITELKEVGEGRAKRIAAKFQDETGTMDLVWFQYSKWLKEQIPINREIFIFGKISVFNQMFSMAHPELRPKKVRKRKHVCARFTQVPKNSRSAD